MVGSFLRSLLRIPVFAGLLLLLFSQNAAAQPSSIGPILEFEDSILDLDTLIAGLHRFQFHFVNAGDEDLIFESCKTSCGCLVASCPREPIPPGAKGEIDVAFNTVGRSGPQQKSITISTNDRQRPIRAIRVVAYIVPLPAQPAEFFESPPAGK